MDSTLTRAEKVALVAIIQCGDGGVPPQHRMKDILQCGRTSVYNSYKSLEAKGYLVKRGRKFYLKGQG